jgi:hypothetical protein
MKKKIFPKIKKKLQNFLLDESWKITKKNALGIAAATSLWLWISDAFAWHTSHTSAIPGWVWGWTGHSSFAHWSGLSCPSVVQTANTLSWHVSQISSGHTSGTYSPSHTSNFSAWSVSWHGSGTGHASHWSSGTWSWTGSSCFTFTQRVLTPSGYKAIGTLLEGDTVISYNHENNEYETSVINKFINHDWDKYYLNDYSESSLLRIFIVSEYWEIVSIETTDIHPFYDIKMNTYKRIDTFKLWDEMFLYQKKWILKKIEIIFDKNNFNPNLEKPIVYNLHMCENHNHNYFVEWCLVHNAMESWPTLEP